MSAMAKLRYFGRSAGLGLWRSPFIHFVAVLTVAISLFTLGLARGASLLVEDVVGRLGGDVQLTVYLKAGLGADEAQAVVTQLGQQGYSAARVVTPTEALARLRKQLGEQGAALADIRENPLPTSVEVSVPPALRSPAVLGQLAQGLRARAEVEDVDYGEEAVRRLSALARGLRWAGLFVWVVVMVATIIIVSATLQLAIYARREEVEIQKLVGATDRFVKAPFLLEGLFQGVLGGLTALAALWAFSTHAAPRLQTLFAFLQVQGARVPFDASLALQVLGAGALLGLFGSFVAVGRFLRI